MRNTGPLSGKGQTYLTAKVRLLSRTPYPRHDCRHINTPFLFPALVDIGPLSLVIELGYINAAFFKVEADAEATMPTDFNFEIDFELSADHDSMLLQLVNDDESVFDVEAGGQFWIGFTDEGFKVDLQDAFVDSDVFDLGG